MNFYDDLEVHRLLVGDEVRTRAFYNSIRATVRPGDTVLDVGAGSGILSLFAAAAGARCVYAIERARGAAAVAHRMVAANGFSGVIQIIEADAEYAHLPEQVDVLVSEWLGVYGVDENMLAPVLAARDRWLKPGGTLIPSAVTAWLAPVRHKAAQEAMQFHVQPYGLNTSVLARFSPHEVVWLARGVAPEHLRAEPQPLWVTDCSAMPAADARTPYAAQLTFKLHSSGVNGLAAWFSAEMPGAAILSNGPGQSATHWGQFLFPIAGAHLCGPGEELHIGFHNVPASSFGSHHIWASQVNGQPLEVHDTRRNRRTGWEPPWRPFLDGTEGERHG